MLAVSCHDYAIPTYLGYLGGRDINRNDHIYVVLLKVAKDWKGGGAKLQIELL